MAESPPLFVRRRERFKDGREHRYWSVVENCRVRGGRVVQRQVLYPGEINDSQRAAWCRAIEVLEGRTGSRQVSQDPPSGVAGITVKCVRFTRPYRWKHLIRTENHDECMPERL